MNSDEDETNTPTKETGVLYVKDEISIQDKSQNGEALESLSDIEDLQGEPFYDASNELGEYQEQEPIVIQLKDERQVEVPNISTKVLRKEQRHRQVRSRGQRTMPELKGKNHYLVGVKARGSTKNKVTGCYLTQDIEIPNKTKTKKIKYHKKIKKEAKR